MVALPLNENMIKYMIPDFEGTDNIPALLGEPAIGKSAIARQINDFWPGRTVKTFVFPVNEQSEKADILGVRTVDEGPELDSTGEPTGRRILAHRTVPHEIIASAIAYAEKNPDHIAVIDLDEYNRADEDITNFVMTMPTNRSIGKRRFPDNVRFMVTGNLTGNLGVIDDAGVSRLVMYEVYAHAGSWMKFMGDNLNRWIGKVLTDSPELIFCRPGSDNANSKASDARPFESFVKSKEMTQFTAPRTITGLNNYLNRIDTDTVLDMLAESVPVDHTVTTGPTVDMLRLVIESHVGVTAFAQQLHSVITADLNASANSGSGSSGTATKVTSPDEPSCYTDLRTAATLTDLSDKIDALDAAELPELLTFLLTRSCDMTGSAVIAGVVEKLGDLTTQQARRVTDLSDVGLLDAEAVRALYRAVDNITTSTSVLDAIRDVIWPD